MLVGSGVNNTRFHAEITIFCFTSTRNFFQDLLRLTAYNQNYEQLPNTGFFITENDLDSFEIGVENGEYIISVYVLIEVLVK